MIATSSVYTFPAPAKLNLFLHITGRRADGYHLLQTVFQFLDYSDTLHFQARTDANITVANSATEIAQEDDLVWRAAQLLQQHSGSTQGVDIRVEKQIPLGGGLGGGSSNAATTLLALNQLWSLNLPQATLAQLGLQLGADVPVFVHGYAAWAEGVGEILTPIDLPEPWFVVVHPKVWVSTAKVFNALDLPRNQTPICVADFFAGQGGNACEAVVQQAYPAVAAALDWLGQYATARLTGTGACIFAAFNSQREADAVLQQLPVEWTGFVARGMNRSEVLEHCLSIKNLTGLL